VKLEIALGYPGTYYINFFVGGIYSEVLQITTDFPAATVTIKKEPSSNFDQQIGHRVGDYLNEVQVAVEDKDGMRLPGYTVIAALDQASTNRSLIMLDYLQSKDVDDQYYALSGFKVA